MPRVSRSREIEASPRRVWRLVSNPHDLPRWWPRVTRVEAVELMPQGTRSRWTKVLGTRGGRGVRADYRCEGSSEERRYAWAQELEGSPFAKHLAAAETEILLEPASAGTLVTISSYQRMRGLSRLGGFMMKGAARRLIDEALDGMERALVPASGGGEAAADEAG